MLGVTIAGAAAAAPSLPAAPRPQADRSPVAPFAPARAIPSGGEGLEVVILAHGMGRTRYSMIPLERALEAEGYEVVNYGYPSRSASVAELARGLSRRIAGLEKRSEVERVHLVGHSLGNVLIRWVVAHKRPAKLGRIVMLAPPNRGSRQADMAAPWLTWLSAPLPELTTFDHSTVRTLATPPDVPIGIIAGSRDATVPVMQTFLDGPCDCEHVVVPSGHTFIMRRELVHQLTASYLKNGSFFD